MLPHPIRPEPVRNDSHPLRLPDLTYVLEQHVQSGFPPDLALDLVLNELVVRAADATHASAAALALVRGDEMVYRAATGLHAPDLGIPLNTRDGLSGACVRTRWPQLCNDTESDARVDPASSRRLGIRSMLIVPVFEPASNKAADDILHTGLHNDEQLDDTAHDSLSNDAVHGDELNNKAHIGLPNNDKVSEIRPHQLAGVLEVFSPLPNAFSQSAETVLGDFARECARIRSVASHLRARPPVDLIPPEDESTPAFIAPAFIANDSPPARERFTQPYQAWTLVLAALLILAAATLSFLIGSRFGWLRSPQPASMQPASTSQPAGPASAGSSAPVSANSAPVAHTPSPPRRKSAPEPPAHSTNGPSANSNDLVVYEKGKVVFRMQSSHDSTLDKAAAQVAAPTNLSSANSGIVSPNAVWLAPEEAESRLLNRVEPQYPADAIAAHRSGEVTLEVHVAEDGSVSSVQTLSGDPLLATAAAQAVRNWRYQPYRSHEQPSPFQTDVTLTFSLPN
jgi:TonB family protein